MTMSGPVSTESLNDDLKKDEDLLESLSIMTDWTESITPMGEETEDGYNSGEQYDAANMAGYASGEMYDLPIADHPLKLKERRNSHIAEEDTISRDTATPPLDPYLIHEISRTPPLDTSGVDSDFTIQNMSYASDSSGPLIKSWDNRARKRGVQQVNREEKKKPRNRRHDHFFHIWDNKYWGFARVGLFWLSMTSILSCIGSAAVMVILMPRQCDPSRGWWQGEVILEVAPTHRSYEGGWRDMIDVHELMEQVPFMEKAGFKALKLNGIYVQYGTEENTWTSPDDIAIFNGTFSHFDLMPELVRALHENNMTLMVEIPALEKGTKLNENVPRRNNMTMELSQAVDRAIKFWAVKGIDGIAIEGLQNFLEDPWMADNTKSWKKTFDKYGTSPKTKILSSSYLVKQNAMENFKLLDDRTKMPRDSFISHVENVSRWDSAPSKPWINWNLLTSNHAEMALHMFLPGTITLRLHYNNISSLLDPNSLSSQLTAIRLRAVPVHMNGNYRKCHGCKDKDIWTTKETNYKIHQLKDVVLLERFYNRRNRYMVIANLKEHSVNLEEVSRKYSGGQLILNTSSTAQTPRFIKFSQINLDTKQALVIKFPK